MPWPPPVLPVNRTDALAQQANHPTDHNTTNQAVNDIVAQINARVAAATVMSGGATGPILANSTYTPFTLTVPAAPVARIVLVTFQYYVSVATGGSCSVELHHAIGDAILSSVVAHGGAAMSVAGSYAAAVAAGAEFPMYLLIKATGAQTDVFADAFANRIHAIGFPS